MTTGEDVATCQVVELRIAATRKAASRTKRSMFSVRLQSIPALLKACKPRPSRQMYVYVCIYIYIYVYTRIHT